MVALFPRRVLVCVLYEDAAENRAVMKVTVTTEDIVKGRPGDPDCCPMGAALSRAGLLHEGVTGYAVMVRQGEGHVDLLILPERVREWVLGYDRGEPMQPISFELTPGSQEEWPPIAA